MLVPSRILYFFGALGSSVRNQPPMLTATGVGLNNSMLSSSGQSVWVRISLITTGGMAGSGSSAPGEPPGAALARHLAPSSGVAPGTFGTNEKPKPSGVAGQGATSA